MPRDEIKRYIVGPAGTKVAVVFASRRDNKGITVQLEKGHAHSPMLHGPESNSIRLKCTLGIMIREASATARKAETDQAASQTEAKAVETRTGAGRQTDTSTAIGTETANVAETATGSTH